MIGVLISDGSPGLPRPVKGVSLYNIKNKQEGGVIPPFLNPNKTLQSNNGSARDDCSIMIKKYSRHKPLTGIWLSIKQLESKTIQQVDCLKPCEFSPFQVIVPHIDTVICRLPEISTVQVGIAEHAFSKIRV